MGFFWRNLFFSGENFDELFSRAQILTNSKSWIEDLGMHQIHSRQEIIAPIDRGIFFVISARYQNHKSKGTVFDIFFITADPRVSHTGNICVSQFRSNFYFYFFCSLSVFPLVQSLCELSQQSLEISRKSFSCKLTLKPEVISQFSFIFKYSLSCSFLISFLISHFPHTFFDS